MNDFYVGYASVGVSKELSNFCEKIYATKDTRADIEDMFLSVILMKHRISFGDFHITWTLHPYLSFAKIYEYTASLPMGSNETFINKLYDKNESHHIMKDYNYNQLRDEMIDFFDSANMNIENTDLNVWLYNKVYSVCIKYEVKHELSIEEGIQGDSLNVSKISIDVLLSDTVYVKLIKPYGNNELTQDVCFVIGEYKYRTDFGDEAYEFQHTQRFDEYNWTNILPTSIRPLTYDESYLYEI